MKKKTSVYESIHLLLPNFTQEEILEKMEYYQKLLTNFGSEVKIYTKGNRPLSYPIRGFDSANYVKMIYSGNDKILRVLNKEVGRDDSILRCLTIRLQINSLTEIEIDKQIN